MTDLSREWEDECDNHDHAAGEGVFGSAVESTEAAECEAPLQLVDGNAGGADQPRRIIPGRRCGSF